MAYSQNDIYLHVSEFSSCTCYVIMYKCFIWTRWKGSIKEDLMWMANLIFREFTGCKLLVNYSEKLWNASKTVYTINLQFCVLFWLHSNVLIFNIQCTYHRLHIFQVEFEKHTSESIEDNPKIVKRTLFGRMNPFPQKKVMTFNKHMKDFSFNVTYGDLSFLSAEDLKWVEH